MLLAGLEKRPDIAETLIASFERMLARYREVQADDAGARAQAEEAGLPPPQAGFKPRPFGTGRRLRRETRQTERRTPGWLPIRGRPYMSSPMGPRGGVVTQRSAKASWFTLPTATNSYINRHFRDFVLATDALT